MLLQFQSLGKHWPHRKLEWVMAGLTTSWGGYVVCTPAIFTAPGTAPLFSGLESMTPAPFSAHAFWGVIALAVGLLRALALYINGAHVRTPVIRVIAAFATMFVFSQVLIGLWKTGIANPGIVVYSWLVAADFLSSYAAGKDAITAEVMRRMEQGSINDNSRFSRALSRL